MKPPANCPSYRDITTGNSEGSWLRALLIALLVAGRVHGWLASRANAFADSLVHLSHNGTGFVDGQGCFKVEK